MWRRLLACLRRHLIAAVAAMAVARIAFRDGLAHSVYEMRRLLEMISGFVMRDGCRGGRGGGDVGVLRWLVTLGWRALRVRGRLRKALIAR
jgi:hypothetical protein